jgi:hypothetical protein
MPGMPPVFAPSVCCGEGYKVSNGMDPAPSYAIANEDQKSAIVQG